MRQGVTFKASKNIPFKLNELEFCIKRTSVNATFTFTKGQLRWNLLEFNSALSVHESCTKRTLPTAMCADDSAARRHNYVNIPTACGHNVCAAGLHGVWNPPKRNRLHANAHGDSNDNVDNDQAGGIRGPEKYASDNFDFANLGASLQAFNENKL